MDTDKIAAQARNVKTKEDAEKMACGFRLDAALSGIMRVTEERANLDAWAAYGVKGQERRILMAAGFVECANPEEGPLKRKWVFTEAGRAFVKKECELLDGLEAHHKETVREIGGEEMLAELYDEQD